MPDTVHIGGETHSLLADPASGLNYRITPHWIDIMVKVYGFLASINVRKVVSGSGRGWPAD